MWTCNQGHSTCANDKKIRWDDVRVRGWEEDWVNRTHMSGWSEWVGDSVTCARGWEVEPKMGWREQKESGFKQASKKERCIEHLQRPNLVQEESNKVNYDKQSWKTQVRINNSSIVAYVFPYK